MNVTYQKSFLILFKTENTNTSDEAVTDVDDEELDMELPDIDS